MTYGVMWATCGELTSISGCKVMVLFCYKLTAIVTDDLIRDAKN